MADESNAAHVPGMGTSPIDLHGKPTGGSTLSDELRAGTSIVSGLPGAMNVEHPAVGVMANPVLESNPSGCRVTPYSPLGRHDTNGE